MSGPTSAAVQAVIDDLRAAVFTLDKMPFSTSIGAPANPPCVMAGPPSLTWETYGVPPTGARFPLYVVVAKEDRALERLWDLVPKVAAAIDENTDAVVLRADPASWGNPELPAYLIEVEVPL